MSATNVSGPFWAYGGTIALPGLPLEHNELAGPSGFYQGTAIPDVRYVFNKDKGLPGAARGFVDSGTVCLVDALPQTLSTTAIIATTAVAGAGTVALAATSSKLINSNTPVVGSDSPTAVLCQAIDPGFQTVNINATATVTIAAGTANRFPVGGWIFIGGTAGGAGTFTRVTANANLSTTTTITVSPAPTNTNATAAVMTTNLLHAYMQGQGSVTPTSVWPWIAAGQLSYFDPTQGLARTLTTVSSGAGDTTQTITVRGYDVFMNPMAETLAMNGTTPVAGVKAFKYIRSVTASAAFAGNLSVGVSDSFGLPLRSDFFEHLQVFMAGAAITANTGYTAADQAVATATTGDVRGKYAVQTASNGARRLTIWMHIPPWNAVNSTPNVTAPLYGATQFTS